MPDRSRPANALASFCHWTVKRVIEGATRLIGWAGKVLAEHPDQRRALVENPALIPQAIEELLRYEPPAPQPHGMSPATSSTTVRPCPKGAS